MSRIGFRSQFCNNSINVLRTQQICSQVTLTDGQVYIKSAVKKLTQYTSNDIIAMAAAHLLVLILPLLILHSATSASLDAPAPAASLNCPEMVKNAPYS